MSSIDNTDFIRNLIERNGQEPASFHKGKRILTGPRHLTEQIWAYITGFGGTCYKLIYGMYPNGMDDKDAAARFLGSANIKQGTTPTCLYHSGKLTMAGKMWWIGLWGEDTLPK